MQKHLVDADQWLRRSCLYARKGEVIEIIVAQVFSVPRELLKSGRRGKASVARARQVAMYLAHVIAAIPILDIAQAYGRDRSTVAYACQVIENGRDEPVFNRTLDLLEGIVARVWRLMLINP